MSTIEEEKRKAAFSNTQTAVPPPKSRAVAEKKKEPFNPYVAGGEAVVGAANFVKDMIAGRVLDINTAANFVKDMIAGKDVGRVRVLDTNTAGNFVKDMVVGKDPGTGYRTSSMKAPESKKTPVTASPVQAASGTQKKAVGGTSNTETHFIPGGYMTVPKGGIDGSGFNQGYDVMQDRLENWAKGALPEYKQTRGYHEMQSGYKAAIDKVLPMGGGASAQPKWLRDMNALADKYMQRLSKGGDLPWREAKRMNDFLSDMARTQGPMHSKNLDRPIDMYKAQTDRMGTQDTAGHRAWQRETTPEEPAIPIDIGGQTYNIPSGKASGYVGSKDKGRDPLGEIKARQEIVKNLYEAGSIDENRYTQMNSVLLKAISELDKGVSPATGAGNNTVPGLGEYIQAARKIKENEGYSNEEIAKEYYKRYGGR